MRKLGLIAGGGALPVTLAGHCAEVGRPLHVLRIEGFADPALEVFPGEARPLLDLEGAIAALKAARCECVCLAGSVTRPELRDAELRSLGGDDALLSAVLARLRDEGFRIEGAHEVMRGLTIAPGPLGRHAPDERALRDLERARTAALAIGALDIGQGAVCRDNVVLALEAQEGTDAMLRRVADLARDRGLGPGLGVLVKTSKPGQDLRVDLPTIGPETVTLAAAAGLAGVAGEAGRVLLVEPQETRARADRLGLFVFGV